MMNSSFSGIRTWIFDLDNTLYPPSVRLFDQIEVRMTEWVMNTLNVGHAEADRLRKHYWRQYGTTLAGLMQENGMEPGPFLFHVHDIDFSVLPQDQALAKGIAALPGRRIIYTNGTKPYAEHVIAARGLDGLFDAIYGVEEAGFRPKPNREAFETIFEADGLNPSEAAMFEDDPRNLAVPHDMGLRTILVSPTPSKEPYIEYQTDDLTGFISGLTGTVA